MVLKARVFSNIFEEGESSDGVYRYFYCDNPVILKKNFVKENIKVVSFVYDYEHDDSCWIGYFSIPGNKSYRNSFYNIEIPYSLYQLNFDFKKVDELYQVLMDKSLEQGNPRFWLKLTGDGATFIRLLMTTEDPRWRAGKVFEIEINKGEFMLFT